MDDVIGIIAYADALLYKYARLVQGLRHPGTVGVHYLAYQQFIADCDEGSKNFRHEENE